MKKAEIYYYRLPNCKSKQEKLQLLDSIKFKDLAFDRVFPDKDANWINQTNNDFDTLIPVCDKQTKLGKNQHAIFKLFSLGVSTNRDDWVFDFNENNLKEKIQFFIETYNNLVKNNDDNWNKQIKWSEYLKGVFNRKQYIDFNKNLLIKSTYRPFVKQFYYSESLLSDRLTQNHYDIFGNSLDKENKIIMLSQGQRANFFCLGSKYISSLDIFMPNATNCLPLYIYNKENKQQENITNWALELFQNNYNNQEITKEQIFNYVYAVLHDPKYRQKYEQNLKREFPRIPFYDNFEQWAKFGKELIDLHLNYETVEKYPLTRIDSDNAKEPIAKLKTDKAKGVIFLDDNTRLENVPCEAWDYKLGNRSALEWVLDQYKEKTPKDATIAKKFKTYHFADYREHVIDLLCRVCKVSVATVHIVQAIHDLSPINDD